MKFINNNLLLIIMLTTKTFVFSDLRMASSPKNKFQIENSNNAIPFVKESIAVYFEPNDFNYVGLENQRINNYDNFLRSNIDNQHDNRDFYKEVGRDMLPFRTLEGGNSINEEYNRNYHITAYIGKETIIPLRWNNPHSAECEINLWIKSIDGYDIVIPIKKPSCCGEGYQDNVISFIIPLDFVDMYSKVPGFSGCNNLGDCTLQLYAHSVEPRTYAIGSPIIIFGNNNFNMSKNFATDYSLVDSQTVDPMLNLNYLDNDICLPTTSSSSHISSCKPRFARLVSDQFNHAYQNSDYSPYSGQQHESISKNLQSAIILRMVASSGELSKSLFNNDDINFIDNLIKKVNFIVSKYETEDNNIFNKIKDKFEYEYYIGNQKLAKCFRCYDTGSVNNNRIERQTYIPSFFINDKNISKQIKNSLPNDLQKLIINDAVQIYFASLKFISDDFNKAYKRGFIYHPAMLKPNITTMKDITKFLKVDNKGNIDNGIFASSQANIIKKHNIEKIISLIDKFYSYKNNTTPFFPTTSINDNNIFTTSFPVINNTLPPNPDDNLPTNPYDNLDLDKNNEENNILRSEASFLHKNTLIYIILLLTLIFS